MAQATSRGSTRSTRSTASASKRRPASEKKISAVDTLDQIRKRVDARFASLKESQRWDGKEAFHTAFTIPDDSTHTPEQKAQKMYSWMLELSPEGLRSFVQATIGTQLQELSSALVGVDQIKKGQREKQIKTAMFEEEVARFAVQNLPDNASPQVVLDAHARFNAAQVAVCKLIDAPWLPVWHGIGDLLTAMKDNGVLEAGKEMAQRRRATTPLAGIGLDGLDGLDVTCGRRAGT